ncbi:hypothetical protein BaRGS_00008748 [Batillaria attramentaria]|uniref:Uncharacterized protein n=1 Tax=Batillaria attramentaria TaxID=370345 RepID=A0ABD0LKC9_9CAEN
MTLGKPKQKQHEGVRAGNLSDYLSRFPQVQGKTPGKFSWTSQVAESTHKSHYASICFNTPTSVSHKRNEQTTEVKSRTRSVYTTATFS